MFDKGVTDNFMPPTVRELSLDSIISKWCVPYEITPGIAGQRCRTPVCTEVRIIFGNPAIRRECSCPYLLGTGQIGLIDSIQDGYYF